MLALTWYTKKSTTKFLFLWNIEKQKQEVWFQRTISLHHYMITFACVLVLVQFKSRPASAVITSRNIVAEVIAIHQQIPVFKRRTDCVPHFSALILVWIKLLHFACCCCCSAYLSLCHRTASDANCWMIRTFFIAITNFWLVILQPLTSL